jgi:regulator of protease activity HflC (stomatin/prohibitin superfamily)
MGYLVAGVIIFFYAVACLNVLREYERAVIFRLGRVQRPDKGPGLIWIWWPIDKIVKVSLRIDTWDVPSQDIITRDNIPVKVNAVLFYRIINAQQSVIELKNYRYSIEQLAATTLRAVLGEVELDDLLSQREKLNLRLQTIIDEQTEPWGIKVSQVQVKQVDIPQDMQRAIARQAEAERERRAKIINADGEFQASQKLSDAAKILATEKNTTIVFPIPVELLSILLKPHVAPPGGPSSSKP